MIHKYFDWAATSPISENAIKEYVQTAQNFIGNPSAAHKLGFEAKEKLTSCRNEVARLLNVAPATIYFTSGGTESDSIILNCALNNVSTGKILYTKAEHAAVSAYCGALKQRGWITQAIASPKGFIDLEKLEASLTSDTRYVFIMLVNNVLGSINDLQKAVQIIRSYEKTIGRHIHVHTDAVQALGKIHFDLKALDVDSAAFSAHKFQGPRGVGILYNKSMSIKALSSGGGQELGLRPGTENLSGIASMTIALKDSIENLDQHYAKVMKLNKLAREELTKIGFKVLSPMDNCSPYILDVCSLKIPSEVFVRVLSDKGYCLSAGSACNNNSKKKGEAGLQNLGFSSLEASTSIRISFGYETEEEDLLNLINTMNKTLQEL